MKNNKRKKSHTPQGGDKEKWHLKPKKAKTVERLPPIWDIMEGFLSQVNQIKRTDVPKRINPLECRNFYDLCIQVGIHAYKRQYLSINTIEKRLRYARFMEHYKVPIDFFNLNLENVMEHFDDRIDENAGLSALRHEKKTIRTFLKAFGKWDKTWNENIDLPKEIRSEENRYIPFPSTVYKLCHAKYGNDEYENNLLQTIVFTGFNFGMRPPSEIVKLTIDDVIVNDDGNGYLIITEDKKRGKKRNAYPHKKSVLSSFVFKTPYNYLVHWRPKVANSKSGNALFLRPDGSPVTDYYLRNHITPVFKQICANKSVSLYTMRHTFATYYYDTTKDIRKTAKRLGHKKTDTVDTYVHVLEGLRNQISDNRSLFSQALRQPKTVGGKSEKRDILPKNKMSRRFSPVDQYGPAEYLIDFSKKISETYYKNTISLIFNISSFSLKPLSFLYNLPP